MPDRACWWLLACLAGDDGRPGFGKDVLGVVAGREPLRVGRARDVPYHWAAL